MQIDGVGVSARHVLDVGLAISDASDAREIEPETAERVNQFEASQSRLVVAAIPGIGAAGRRDKADIRVVADGLDREAGQPSHFTDGEVHAGSMGSPVTGESKVGLRL